MVLTLSGELDGLNGYSKLYDIFSFRIFRTINLEVKPRNIANDCAFVTVTVYAVTPIRRFYFCSPL